MLIPFGRMRNAAHTTMLFQEGLKVISRWKFNQVLQNIRINFNKAVYNVLCPTTLRSQQKSFFIGHI